MIEEVLGKVRNWIDSDSYNGKVFINILTQLLHDEAFVQYFIDKLRYFAIPMETIEVELMESENLLKEKKVDQSLEILRKEGVRVAIDDFGTGYSNVDYLCEFKLNKIKLDKSFIKKIGTETRDERIAEGLILLTKTLGYEVTAEGVETEEQYQFLKAKECDSLQGYYFHRPLSEEKCLASKARI
jgi:EAL domain-containing protein (putative c-di-GMP-specific phosphodiesterase class I)